MTTCKVRKKIKARNKRKARKKKRHEDTQGRRARELVRYVGT